MIEHVLAWVLGTLLSGAAVALAVGLFKLGTTIGALTDGVRHLEDAQLETNRRLNRLEQVVWRAADRVATATESTSSPSSEL